MFHYGHDRGLRDIEEENQSEVFHRVDEYQH